MTDIKYKISLFIVHYGFFYGELCNYCIQTIINVFIKYKFYVVCVHILSMIIILAYYYGCVPIFTASTENLIYVTYIIDYFLHIFTYIFNIDSVYQNMTYVF